ncbi:hypothetical protein BDQ17DRAFT_1325630 [Cyathus striatus]|nr:hypothetical protein BDQ17DRAFT_1325630 [Cyathus striatus]
MQNFFDLDEWLATRGVITTVTFVIRPPGVKSLPGVCWNVTCLDHADATSKDLAFINCAGNAVIKVDNMTSIENGPLVWPSFWTLGDGGNWPASGEINLIEAINLMGNNQVAIHTNPGCTLNSSSSVQTGKMLQSDCLNSAGCVVVETKSNSYGETFAQAGGGVFAMRFDVSGIFTWFWSGGGYQ